MIIRLQSIPLSLRVALLSAVFGAPLATLLYFYLTRGGGGPNSALVWQLIIIAAQVLLACAFAFLTARSVIIPTEELRAENESLGRIWGVIQYKPDGTIITANEMLLAQRSYKLSDIVGRHHSIFVPPDYAKSDEYRDFWAKLNRGECIAQKYKRKGAGGNDSWVQNNYIPILDRQGKPFKIVNFMSDVTAMEHEREMVVCTLAESLKKLSDGKLTARIDVPFKGEYEALKTDFNAAMTRLQDTMRSVLEGATVISTGAGEITQAADDLSRRTEQQAASLEETAAALEQITATVKKTAVNTKDVNVSANAAKTAAEEGERIVETAVKAMDNIEQSSKQITDIIGVIDEIAFQTNLLALNAGVEAARAGDAGRGFAVVASEVRALAQRSSEAAKEIKTLIKTSREHVGSGVKFVGETGQALKRIVEQVVQINALVTEMSQAAEQQSTGIEEVNNAVSQMDQVTQQNAAMVEQSTAATRNLASETQTLSELVGFFAVGTDTKAVSHRAPELGVQKKIAA